MHFEDDLRKRILAVVSDSETRVTPLALEQSMLETVKGKGKSRRDIRRVMRSLVEIGELAYASEFGTSYIEKSFSSPVMLGKFIKLIPPGMTVFQKEETIPVRIMPGAAFGRGSHPTTRLCISGIEFLFERRPDLFYAPENRVLDIGTGSGVLAVVSLLMGMDSAVGTDLDPCARSESRTNARLNGVLDRFEFSNEEICRISGQFHLIAANLRTPTLIGLASDIARLLKRSGAVVMSGIRDDEIANVIQKYEAAGLLKQLQITEKKWAGLVLWNHSE